MNSSERAPLQGQPVQLRSEHGRIGTGRAGMHWPHDVVEVGGVRGSGQWFRGDQVQGMLQGERTVRLNEPRKQAEAGDRGQGGLT
jgi:hypothetical protein